MQTAPRTRRGWRCSLGLDSCAWFPSRSRHGDGCRDEVASSRAAPHPESRMKLYGGLASPYVARVVLFARLKGLALEPQMPAGGLKSPEYLAKNPMGKMPALEVDGTVIPES